MIEPGDEPLTLQGWLDLYGCEVDAGDLSPGLLGVLLPADRWGRLIVVNRRLDRPERNLTLWHEIAHLVRRDKSVLEFCRADAWAQNRVERRTDDLAVQLALPASLLARHGVHEDRTLPGGWAIPIRDRIFAEIAEDADVAERAVWHRLGMYDLRTDLPKTPEPSPVLAPRPTGVVDRPELDEVIHRFGIQVGVQLPPEPLPAPAARRVVVYARQLRYAEAGFPSADDQVRRCRGKARVSSWDIVDVLVDHPGDGQPGLRRLLDEAARPGRPFDTVMVVDPTLIAEEWLNLRPILDAFAAAGVDLLWPGKMASPADQLRAGATIIPFDERRRRRARRCGMVIAP